MSKLSNEQAILLDSLVYLNDSNVQEHKTIGAIITHLERNNWGELERSNKNKETGKYPAQLTKQEWIHTLNLIKKDEHLMNMRIEHVEDRSYDPKTKKGSGLKAMVLKDKDGNSVVAFRGTASDPEWMDNGSGMYNSDTLQQKETLDFFNDMVKKHNLDKVTVTGHSKGGNRAQYLALLSDKVEKAIAVER